MFGHVPLHIFNVETVRVRNGRVVFDHSRNFASILLQELGSPVTDCAESLNRKGLSLDSLGQACLLVERLNAQALSD